MLRRVMLNIYDRRRDESVEEYQTVTGRDCVIAETDGGMVPSVSAQGQKNIRKEACLCFAYIPGETTLKFGAEFKEGVDEAGFGLDTYLHSVGDGALWICGQTEKQFGSQGHYPVDFYHICEFPDQRLPHRHIPVKRRK